MYLFKNGVFFLSNGTNAVPQMKFYFFGVIFIMEICIISLLTERSQKNMNQTNFINEINSICELLVKSFSTNAKQKKNKQKAEKTSNQIKTILSMYGAVHLFEQEHSLLSVNLNSSAKIDASTVLHILFTFFFAIPKIRTHSPNISQYSPNVK